MAKRWTNAAMLKMLLGEKAVTATSLQMGRDRAYLSRTLRSDPHGTLSPEVAQRILDAYEAVTNGAPSA